MESPLKNDVTTLSVNIDHKQKNTDELFPLIYQRLRDRVRRQRVALSCHDTLNTTALLSEAYIKLIAAKKKDWGGQTHFLETAALAVKQIIIDYAKGQTTSKRGGNTAVCSFDESAVNPENILYSGIEPELLLALDAALIKLTDKDGRAGKVVLYRFFGNMTIKETAAAMGVSVNTVKRDWNFSRAWLFKQLAIDD